MLFYKYPPRQTAFPCQTSPPSPSSILLSHTKQTSMSFQRFYNMWFEQLRQLAQQLRQAPSPPTTEEHQHQLRQLVQKTISHYAEYYKSKSSFAKQDVLMFFSAPWTTTLERALHWIGGWRPTTAFHIVYTESSILFESHMIDILRGIYTGDLGDLTAGQFHRVSELQIETVQEENNISDELSELQACISQLKKD